MARACILRLSATATFAGLLLASLNCGDSGTGGSGGTGAGGAGNCESPCGLSPQCGCSASEACTIDSKGSHHCALAGTGKPGEECTTIGCQTGAVCVGVSTSPAVSLCASFCKVDADCPAGASCTRHLTDGMGSTLPGVALCTDACDPAANTGCPASGTACVIGQNADGVVFTQCTVPTGTAMEGESCATAKCAPGLLCGQSMAGAVCHALCTIDGSHGCMGAQKCTKLTTPLVIGTIEYGACL